MQTSDRGRAFIAAHEGIVTRAYRDVAGVWTIGVGHTAAAGPPAPKAGMTISRAEALAILAADLPRYERRVAAALPGASQPVFDGAVSFDFNTGAVHRASWVHELNAGRREAARRALMQWTKAGGRTVAGLVGRREAEARLIFAGDYGAGAAGAALPSADMRAVQETLAALGFDPGPIDGLAGPRTRAAVLAYQRLHPDLVADGIAGPATRAGLARDLAARKAVAGSAATAAGTAVAAAAGADAAGQGAPLLWGLAAGAALLLALGVFLARRYGGELRRLLFGKKGL